MSVSRKVLRRMKKVMGLIGTSAVLVPCSSQVSCAKVNVEFNDSTGTLHFSGNGRISTSWRIHCRMDSVKYVIIEGGVEEIGEKAFECCRFLEKVTIPNSVSIIGGRAFCGCIRLKTVKFEDMSRRDVKSCWDVLLRNGAFDLCIQLEILDLGCDTKSRIAKVEWGAFFGCDPNFVTREGRTVRGKLCKTV